MGSWPNRPLGCLQRGEEKQETAFRLQAPGNGVGGSGEKMSVFKLGRDPPSKAELNGVLIVEFQAPKWGGNELPLSKLPRIKILLW